MSVFDVLDEMDDMLDNAKAFAFSSHNIIIDGDRLRELVNDIRLAMPKEMKRAQTIDYDCERIMKEAHANAETIIREAEDRAKAMTAESAIVDEAKRKAHEMIAKTKVKCDQTRNGTAEFVVNSLTATEVQINELLAKLRNERAQWEQK